MIHIHDSHLTINSSLTSLTINSSLTSLTITSLTSQSTHNLRLIRVIIRAHDTHRTIQRTTTQQLTRAVPTNAEDASTRLVRRHRSVAAARLFLFLLLLHVETTRMDPQILVRVERANAHYNSTTNTNTHTSSRSSPRRTPFRSETTCSTAPLSESSTPPKSESTSRSRNSTRTRCSPPSTTECGCSSDPSPNPSQAGHAIRHHTQRNALPPACGPASNPRIEGRSSSRR